MVKLLAIFWTVLLFHSCSSVQKKNEKVFTLYRNHSSSVIQNQETREDYNFIAKMTNPYDEPIIIPFIQNHLLPIEQRFDCDIGNDSLIDFGALGTGHYFYYGLDTLYPGETQRNFVALTEFEVHARRSKFTIISFQYYFLPNFSFTTLDRDKSNKEFFITYIDDTDGIKVFKPVSWFDPYLHRSYPIPR